MNRQLITGRGQGKKRGFAQSHLGGTLEVITSRAKPLLFLEDAMVVNIKGYAVQIDDEDEHIIRDHGWCVHSCSQPGRVYFQANINKKRVLLHRLIIKAPLGASIDHADADTLNNRKINLRFATQYQNTKNGRKHKDNRSGYKGVSWDRKHRRWSAFIGDRYTHKWLGYFLDPREASEAYKKAAIKIAGEFARW